MASVSDFHVLQRVQFHPATDLWMRGERYGTVMQLGTFYVYVEGDKTKRIHRVDPNNILPIESISFC